MARRPPIGSFACFLAAAILAAACAADAPVPVDQQFTVKAVISPCLYSALPNIDSFCFYLFLPADYGVSGTEYPLLIFLQGWGHFGREPDPGLLSAGPLRPLYRSDTELDPDGFADLDVRAKESIIIYPMMPFYDGRYQNPLGWYDPETIDTIVDYMLAEYRIDEKRVYAAGLSEGGGGAWCYAWKYPEKIAAVIPVSCKLSWPVTEELKKMPTWIFHSFDDAYVPHATTSDADFKALTGMANAMAGYPHIDGDGSKPAATDYTISYSPSAGLGPWTPGTVYPTGLISYTLYASGGHDAWTRTFANGDVWKWLYSQSK